MENTNAIISITIMPVCTLLVSTLILFAAFLPPLVNCVTEGKGAVAGEGVKGGCVIGFIMAGLAPALSVRAGEGVRGGRIEGIVVAGLAPAMLAPAPAMLACAGGGVRGNGVKVTGGWLWTAYLGIPPVSGKLPGFQSLVEILAAG
jgi:hypothetical protein